MNVWHAGGQMQIPTASWADPYEPAAKFYVFALLKEKVLFFWRGLSRTMVLYL